MNVIPVSVAVKDFCLNVIKKRTIKSCIVSKKYNTSDNDNDNNNINRYQI